MTNAQHPGPGVLNDMAPYTMQAPIYMRLHEAHGVQGELAAAMPTARRGAPGSGGSQPTFDDGISNAWFAGPTGGIRVSDVVEGGSTSRDAGSASGRRVLFEADGGGRGVYRCWSAGSHLGASEDSNEGEWTGYPHDPLTCEGCRAREEMRAQNQLADALERENLFRSVGLGLNESEEEEEGEEDSDESDGDEDETSDGESQSEEDAADPEWDPTDNTDNPDLRAHSKGKILPCDGVKDIVLFGAVSIYPASFC